MKRWIRATSAIDLDAVKLKEQELKQFFKQYPNGSFTGSRSSVESMIEEYVVSKGLSGRGIELYKHITDADNPHRSFGGGVTLAKGYWDVAQYMLNAERTGIQFTANKLK